MDFRIPSLNPSPDLIKIGSVPFWRVSRRTRLFDHVEELWSFSHVLLKVVILRSRRNHVKELRSFGRGFSKACESSDICCLFGRSWYWFRPCQFLLMSLLTHIDSILEFLISPTRTIQHQWHIYILRITITFSSYKLM